MAYAPKSPDLSSFYSADPTSEAPAPASAAQNATTGAQFQQLPSQQSQSRISLPQDRTPHLQPLPTTYFPAEPTTPGQEQQRQQQQSLQPPQPQTDKYFPADPAAVPQQQPPLTPQSQRPVGQQQQQQAYAYSPYLLSRAGQNVSQAGPGYNIPRQPPKAQFYQSYDVPYQAQAPVLASQFYSQSSATPTTPATSPAPGPPPLSGQGHGQVPLESFSTAAVSTATSALGPMPPKRGGPAVAGPSSATAVEPSPVRTKFPTARIKRIMQADEEVGKVAQQTPIAVGKALEMFMVALVTKSADMAREKNSKRVSAQMLKQVVESDDQWDFLRDIVSRVENEEKAGAGSGKGKAAKAESESEEEAAEKKKRVVRKKRGAA